GGAAAGPDSGGEPRPSRVQRSQAAGPEREREPREADASRRGLDARGPGLHQRDAGRRRAGDRGNGAVARGDHLARRGAALLRAQGLRGGEAERDVGAGGPAPPGAAALTAGGGAGHHAVRRPPPAGAAPADLARDAPRRGGRPRPARPRDLLPPSLNRACGSPARGTRTSASSGRATRTTSSSIARRGSSSWPTAWAAMRRAR